MRTQSAQIGLRGRRRAARWRRRCRRRRAAGGRSRCRRRASQGRRRKAATKQRGDLLGRLDRHPADRRPAALGHVGGQPVRRLGPQGPLVAPVRRPLRRLQQLALRLLRVPDLRDADDPQLRRDPVLQLGLAVDPGPARSQRARLPARRHHRRHLRRLHPRVRRRRPRLGAPLLPPLQLGDERQTGSPGPRTPTATSPTTTSPPGATSTTSSPQVGATNATWVWCPYVNAEPARWAPLRQLLPGRRLRRLDLPRRLQLGQERRQPPALDQLRRDLRPQLPHDRQQAGAGQADAARRDRPPAAAPAPRRPGSSDMFKHAAHQVPAHPRPASGSTRSTAACSGRSRPRPR